MYIRMSHCTKHSARSRCKSMDTQQRKVSSSLCKEGEAHKKPEKYHSLLSERDARYRCQLSPDSYQNPDQKAVLSTRPSP